MSVENCAICVEPLEASTTVRLECGHSFHPNCAIQWFRYHHTSCPLCRSTGQQQRWNLVTPCQRIQGLKRIRHMLPHCIRVRLHRYEELSQRMSVSNRKFVEYRARHRDIIREYLKQENGLRRVRTAKYRLQNELARTHIPDVPHLMPGTTVSLPESQGLVSDDSDEDEDTL